MRLTSAVNRSLIWSMCVRMICGSSLAISIINVAIVFADALSACAATKFVSQISLNTQHLFVTKSTLEIKRTSVIQSPTTCPDNPWEGSSARWPVSSNYYRRVWPLEWIESTLLQEYKETCWDLMTLHFNVPRACSNLLIIIVRINGRLSLTMGFFAMSCRRSKW